MNPDVYFILVGIAGVVTFGSRITSALLNRWFCVRNAPRWLRNSSDVASALLGLRWATLGLTDVPSGLWSLTIVLFFAAISFTVIIYHIYAIFKLGDHCHRGSRS